MQPCSTAAHHVNAALSPGKLANTDTEVRRRGRRIKGASFSLCDLNNIPHCFRIKQSCFITRDSTTHCCIQLAATCSTAVPVLPTDPPTALATVHWWWWRRSRGVNSPRLKWKVPEVGWDVSRGPCEPLFARHFAWLPRSGPTTPCVYVSLWTTTAAAAAAVDDEGAGGRGRKQWPIIIQRHT